MSGTPKNTNWASQKNTSLRREIPKNPPGLRALAELRVQAATPVPAGGLPRRDSWLLSPLIKLLGAKQKNESAKS